MATANYADVLAQIKAATADPKNTKVINSLDSTLAALSHSDLYQLREQAAQDPTTQNILAPYEHRAFAREWATSDPLTAAASLTAAIPGYSIAKALGAAQGRSNASLPELQQGFTGLGEGLMAAIKSALQ